VQRYFTNATHFRVSTNGPVFLQIGGEGEASAKWMVEGTWLNYAAQYGALCFQLEHRFYGKSRPTQDLSTESLHYLSSEQALADLVYFIEGMQAKYSLTKRNKWILFGGSYPGSLAAWARLKYPHMVHGSVSSSGPLVAKSDFKEYFQVVQESLDTSDKHCSPFLHQAVQQVASSLQKYPKDLSTKLTLCDVIDPSKEKDVFTLFESLSGIFADVVQYNKDNRITPSPLQNITLDDLCRVMTDISAGDPIDRLAKLNSMMLQLNNEGCLDFKYENSIKPLKNTSWDATAAEGGRQWTYQTCTEFGFYQTSSTKNELFGPYFPLSYFTQQCTDIFGERINNKILNSGIYRTNLIYGGLELRTTRVIYVHGSIDPWHALGITTNKDNMPAIYIKGKFFFNI
ncbi:hypothetical protein AAG570_011699, partial [Ranatra chinensis]